VPGIDGLVTHWMHTAGEAEIDLGFERMVLAAAIDQPRS
jgi:hypothetical protein